MGERKTTGLDPKDSDFDEVWPIPEKFFAYQHLPPHLQVVSHRFHEVARYIVNAIPDSAERTAALRKLLEAKFGHKGDALMAQAAPSHSLIDRPPAPPSAIDLPHVHYADGVWIARLGNVGGIYAPTLKELGQHWRELGKR